MSATIRSLMIKMGMDLTNMDKSLKTAQKNLKTFGKNMKSAGDTLTKGLTVPIVAVVGGLTTLAVQAAKTGDDLIALSKKTGLSTDALQELQYASKFIDVDMNVMTKSMFKLTKSMDDARKGAGKQADAFKTLGVRITNADGTLRKSEDVWAETIDALSSMENAAERDALAYKLFGKSAQELNPLIAEGTKKLKELMKEAKDLGIVLSYDDLKAANDLKDQLDKLQSIFGTLKTKIGLAFIPVLKSLLPIVQNKIVPALEKFAKWLKNVFDKFSQLTPGQQKFIVALIAIVAALGPVLSLIGSMALGISTLMSPVGLIIAAILVIAGLAAIIIKYWEPIKKFFIDKIITPIKNAIQGVKDFIAKVKAAVIEFKKFIGVTDKEGNNYSDSFFPELPYSNNPPNKGGGGGIGGRGPDNNYTGTLSARRGWSWVGEKGPELMYMHGGERILSNKDSMAMINSGEITVKIAPQPVALNLNGRQIATAILPEMTKKIKLAGGV